MKSFGFGILLTCWWTLAGAQSTWTRFAIIGDFGTDDANELAVSQLVKINLQPEFIITTGDNQYDGVTAYDRDVGKYYHEYIGHYSGAYGSGSPTNRFWPSLGNHDYQDDDYAAYTEFFTLPGNERYYDVVLGPLHFFMCNSGGNEPDGNGSTSLQAHWLSNQLARSKSPWKIIVLHHPPYSSSGFSQELRWPFEQWGAHAVLAGHVHSYERLDVPGFPYIVNGAGGAALEGDVTPIAASRAQYNADHGAMLGRATAASLELSFVSVAEGGTVIDTLTITNQASPRLRVTRLGGGTNEISWSTNFVGYALESATSLKSASSWAQVSQSPSVRGASYSVRIGATGNAAYYRLRAAAAT